MPYSHQFSALADHLQVIVGQGGYALLFLLTLLEGIPVLGMAIPGHIAIIIGGFFARIGTLNLWWVIVISICGAVMGDFIGFTLGRKYGMSFIDKVRPYFFVTDAHIEKTRTLLQKHTGKAMIIGRFTPATRALMPFLVGTGQTSPAKFWFFNIIGGVSWSVISVLIGYVFGAGYHAAAGVIGRGMVFAIAIAVITIWGYRFVNMRFHIFRKYELFTLALNIVSLGFLMLMLQDAISSKPFMVNFDVWVSEFMNAHNHGTVLYDFIGNIGFWMSVFGGTAVMGGFGMVTAIWFSLKKKWRSAAIMLLAMGSAGVLTGILKEYFLRDRPTLALETIVNDPSFPSGHAVMAAAFFVAIAYLLAPKINSWVKRELFLVLCVVCTFLIGLSRLILNVHWSSDVIAGWSLGAFCATASILLVKYIGNLLVKKNVITLQPEDSKTTV